MTTTGPTPSAANVSRNTMIGLLSAVAAFTIWGLATLYWPLLEPASPLEILAHRVVWTLVVCVLLLPMVHGWADVSRAIRTPRLLGLLALATVFISVNWGTFIWAVTNDQVLQSSLGYFINPILTVLLGVVILGERLSRPQWLAVAVGAVAMLILVAGFGGLPIVSIALAISFSSYGFIKKRANIAAIPSLAIESGIALPVALVFLGWLWTSGDLSFGHDLNHTLLLIGAGVITAAPLLFFGAAAIRVPLSTLGILQYVAPILQFVLALAVFGEQMSAARWAGFILIWLALGLFSWDLVANSARTRLPFRGNGPRQ